MHNGGFGLWAVLIWLAGVLLITCIDLVKEQQKRDRPATGGTHIDPELLHQEGEQNPLDRDLLDKIA